MHVICFQLCYVPLHSSNSLKCTHFKLHFGSYHLQPAQQTDCFKYFATSDFSSDTSLDFEEFTVVSFNSTDYSLDFEDFTVFSFNSIDFDLNFEEFTASILSLNSTVACYNFTAGYNFTKCLICSINKILRVVTAANSSHSCYLPFWCFRS